MTERGFTFFPDASRVPVSAEDLSVLIMQKPQRIGIYMHEFLRLGWRAECYEALLLAEITSDNVGEAVNHIASTAGMMMAKHGVNQTEGRKFIDQSTDLLIRAVNNFGMDEPLNDRRASEIKELSNIVYMGARKYVSFHAARMS